MSVRLAVDVGGTFTDAVYLDEQSRHLRVGKRPSTPAAPERGVLSAIEAVMAGEPLDEAEFFFHGTTVGLNALLQRRGPTIGLLTTEGFVDILEIGRGDWSVSYDLRLSSPVPLVARRLRKGVRERISADGHVVLPLRPEDVEAAATAFASAGVASVAIVFLNAYINPEHELQAAQLLREFGFAGEISLSHAISGEHREFERTSTTVVDVYIRPLMTDYLHNLEQGLDQAGFDGTPLVTRSGGGAIPFDQAAQRPVDTILSGPVGGVQGAAAVARELALARVITADMGGTSFETCLISQGRPTTIYRGEIEGFPILTPWVDVRTIGAGGGSIAFVDEGGLLRVGPRSAGADPGPAAYALGGVEPTVSDAAVALGMFGRTELAGGVKLDHERALAALAQLSDPLGLDAEGIARGVVTIATTNMANAIREITVERGEDPREAALMSFGGAGPLFATLLATELEIPEIIVPLHAGNFSAWGLLGADLVHTASRTRILALSSASLSADVEATASGLFEELRARAGITETDERWDRLVSLDLRYVGQEYSLTVDTGMHVDRDQLLDGFHRAYSELYGHSMEQPVEVVSIRATLRQLLPSVPMEMRAAPSAERSPHASVSAYSFSRDATLEFAVIDRDSLAPGDAISGPAIVLESIATTYVDADFEGTVDRTGALLLRRVKEDR